MFLLLEEVFKALSSSHVSRNIKEGQELLNSNHIITCGTTKKSEYFVELFALCLQTSALKSIPHEITGRINFSPGQKTRNIENFKCTCKAGNSGRCKHIAAVLLLCTRHNIFQFPETSQTDKSCSWNVLKGSSLQQYEAKPILHTPCFNSKRDSIDLKNPLPSELILQDLLKVSCNSALAKHKRGRRQELPSRLPCSDNNVVVNKTSQELNTKGEEFIKYFFKQEESVLMKELAELNVSCEKSCCQSTYSKKYDKCAEYICMRSRTDEEFWKEERKFRITGSRIYSIFTYSQNQWDMKALKYFNPKQILTPAMRHGKIFESTARESYRKLYKEDIIEMGLIVSTLNSWLGYSPDGVVLKDGKPHKLVEIKCVEIGKSQTASLTNEAFLCKCSFLQIKDGCVTLKRKHMYYGQIQLGMAMLGVEQTDFIVFASFDNSFITISVEFDYNFCKKMLFKVKSIFFKNMLHVICDND